MKFISTKIAGAYIIELEMRVDGRGFLARSWDANEFNSSGIELNLLQGYTCFTKHRGTIRGLHYSPEINNDIKLNRIISGSFYEVILDLRPNSPTYKTYLGWKFKVSDYKMLVIPAGCAHAIQTLVDNTEYIAYYSQYYDPQIERGLRWNDPAFAIDWPITKNVILSEKDRQWPNFKS